MDIGFLLDSSASEGRSNFQKQVNFVKTFVNQLQVGPTAAQVRDTGMPVSWALSPGIA